VLVVVDRISWGKMPRERLLDSLETAFRMGHGRIAVVALPDNIQWFSSDLSCALCRVHIPLPTPNLFSFNSPLGACPECRGFGRTIGVDMDLVIPNPQLSLEEGAVKPWTPDRIEHHDLLEFCRKEGIPVDVPYQELSEGHRRKIFHGAKDFYGIKGFFDWLEQKKYKMHVRVFLSRYRAYNTCEKCGGSRYQPDTLLYFLRGISLEVINKWSIQKCYDFFNQPWSELK
jgi:excinuclease ABC subunit A